MKQKVSEQCYQVFQKRLAGPGLAKSGVFLHSLQKNAKIPRKKNPEKSQKPAKKMDPEKMTKIISL